MSRNTFFRAGIRITQRLALLSVALAATAVADGSLSPVSTPAFGNEVEGSLVRAIVGLRETGIRQALGEIDKALANNPNFRLGHMVKGDLLMARAGRPVAFASTAASADSVASLQDEARVRVKRYVEAPPVDYLPAPLLQLAPQQSHVLLIDTSRSRLFVYANDLGRPRYVTDFYISLGKNGIDKTREGDQKTPIGVYRIISAKDKLPDFYGPGAFPVDYPHDWDKLHGRKGHGIWLHGTPSATYSRPPWATDGCIVLTNEDFAKLRKYVDVSRTPVVIGQGVEWRERERWESERASFMAAFTRWRTDWESLDTNRYLSHYSNDFRSETKDAATWKSRKRKVATGKTWVKVAANDMSLFAYPGAKDTMMVTFEQDYRSNNLSNRTVKRQFWVREGQAWRIVHEAVIFVVPLSFFLSDNPMRFSTRLAIASAAFALPFAAAAQTKGGDCSSVKLTTSMGAITLALDKAKAPVTVDNFTKYVKAGHYNGTVFHRVIDNFMIQGGGMTKDMKEKSTNPPIKNEASNGLKNENYTVAMARTNDPNSATAQFFINVKDNEFLNYTPSNPGYAVFGKVTDGKDTVEKIKKVATGNAGMHQNVPTTPVVLEKAECA